jgi:selenide,water dikinase
LAEKCIPGGTLRNYAAYGHKMSEVTDFQRNILCDPQTSGGLLVAIRADKVDEFQNLLFERNLPTEPIGFFTRRRDYPISVY